MASILGYSFIFFFTILSILYVIQPLFLEEVKYSVDETTLSLKREKIILYNPKKGFSTTKKLIKAFDDE